MADTMEDILLEQLPAEPDRLTGEFGGAEADDPPPCDGEVRLGDPPPAEGVSQLGLTVAQPQTGALRPTLVLGVGGFGRRALLELRCRFLDRLGDLDKTPLIRFLYVDSDADAVKTATRGASEVAFHPGEVYHLPLQPVSHYRGRQLEHLSEWLPREKLYGMPRALKTQGSRALGRLALTDNYRRLMGTLKRDLQKVCHPDSICRTVSETGLALRDGTPRVYVVAAAGGGGGGGCLADLGYAVRRLLKQMHHPDATVTALVFCGAPEDPATPPAEQANVYATLTELNHFADPAVPFSAQYGADGPRLVDEGSAFDQAYLLPLAGAASRRGAAAAEEAFLLIPASDAGRRYGEEAQFTLPGVHLVNVPGQADLMFCREQQALTAEDLDRLLRSCRAAYEEAAANPITSPHARFDIQDWTPLGT
jgi:hypothetical protein